MKLVTLVENLVNKPGLCAEHGLSMYFEADGLKFLMDVGQSDVFLNNADKLDVSISDVDYLIISHGHYDHTGGIGVFLQNNSKAKIIIRKGANRERYSKGRYVGMPSVQIPEERILYTDGCMQLSPSVVVCDKAEIVFPQDRHIDGFTVIDNNKEYPDGFSDELFICILHENSCSVLSSCSHNGITNFVEHVKELFSLPVKAVIGGFHLKNASAEDAEHIISYFNKTKVQTVGFSHCSGIENYASFKKKCTAEVFYNETGNCIQL